MKAMWFDNREEQQDKPERQAIRSVQQKQMIFLAQNLHPLLFTNKAVRHNKNERGKKAARFPI
jgi:hypothetical protein